MKMTTNSCPCCSSSLLRHVRHTGVYWFCQSCRQEVPPLCTNQPESFTHKHIRQRPSSHLVLA
jgi:ribosomal protein L37AE/L43A